ncbi:MAG: hypothetical protein WCO49_20235 [Nostocales cyanobacterium ELA608]
MFIKFVREIQNEIFPRFKDEKVDIEANEWYDIVWEEVDGYVNRTLVEKCEKVLLDYGFTEALTVYDETYGLDSLKGMESFRRIKCILECVVHQEINENIVEQYKTWFNENKDEDEGEGEGNQ